MIFKIYEKKAIGIGILVVLLAVLIVPLAVYGGATVQYVELNSGFALSEEPSSADGLILTQSGNYDVSDASLTAQVRNENAWQRGFSEMTGDRVRVQEGEEDQSDRGQSVADISFNMIVITPSNRSIEKSFSPQELKGTGQKNVTMILTEDELNGETGIFTIQVSMHIVVTPPVFDEPVLDKSVEMGTRTFTIE